jgi:protein-tyrosine phosphatase
MTYSFVDIHCHLLPGIDDGAQSLDDALAMARLAVEDGTTTIVATPHQLGNFGHNRGDDIRRRVAELQQQLDAARIAIKLLPGADVRIEPGMVETVLRGDVLTLGDHRRHVLLELPHELYLPLGPVLDELSRRKMAGVLSHPERNQGILRQPSVMPALVDSGCLMQITAGSVCGTFGPNCQQFCEWMLAEGLVHFVATDAHGPRYRRPLMRRAFERVVELTDEATALELCSVNPAHGAAGRPVQAGRRDKPRRRSWFSMALKGPRVKAQGAALGV